MSTDLCVPDDSIEDPIERLKALADCYWHRGEPDQAFKTGQTIIQLGEQHKVYSHQGLGYMVCGDARNDQHRYEEAWELLDKASQCYGQAAEAGEPDATFHQARTVIGKLVAAIGADRTKQVESDLEKAKEIFQKSTRPEAVEKLATLHQNAGIFFWRLGRFEDARAAYDLILSLIPEVKTQRPDLEPMIYLQIGHIYGHRGESRESMKYFEKALRLFEEDERLRQGVFIAHQNLAAAELNCGLYQECLSRLEKHLTPEQIDIPHIRFGVQRIMVECFLALNNFTGAAEVSEKLAEVSDPVEATDRLGPALMFLATAQAELGKYDFARANFVKALQIFEKGGFPPQMNLIRLRLAQVEFQQQAYEEAVAEAQATLKYWIDTGHMLQEADARLLLANIAYVTDKPSEQIITQCEAVLDLAEKCDSFQHRYAANVLLGHIAQREKIVGDAERHYKAALDAVDQVQRHLAMPFRPGFLSDKGEALRALVRLYLDTNRPEDALEAIEYSRIQVLYRYFAAGHPLQIEDDALSQDLNKRLAALRKDFVAYSNTGASGLSFDQDAAEVQEEVRLAARQKANEIGQEIRDITQRLHNRSHSNVQQAPFAVLPLRDLQQAVGLEKTAIAYYDNGEQIIGFYITAHSIHSEILARSADIKKLIHDLDIQVNFALNGLSLVTREDAQRRGDDLLRLPSLNQPTLRKSFERVSAKLYDALVKPLEPFFQLDAAGTARPLVIVPYGSLHFVPFHLLFDATHGQFLIQQSEVTIMPTASLIGQRAQDYPSEAVIIYDEQNGKLRHSFEDAQRLSELMSALNLNVHVYSAREARSNGVLHQSSGYILHIIAHAKFDEFHPELSFIQLDGQPLMMTDILQGRLPYRLVVLTACETGQLNVVEREGRGLLGDDLLGLGRTFSYAGASAVLSSRWLLGDGMTLPLLERFYAGLQGKLTLAAALRGAQNALTNPAGGIPTLHPTFWGSFQLIGDSGQLMPFN